MPGRPRWDCGAAVKSREGGHLSRPPLRDVHLPVQEGAPGHGGKAGRRGRAALGAGGVPAPPPGSPRGLGARRPQGGEGTLGAPSPCLRPLRLGWPWWCGRGLGPFSERWPTLCCLIPLGLGSGFLWSSAASKAAAPQESLDVALQLETSSWQSPVHSVIPLTSSVAHGAFPAQL